MKWWRHAKSIERGGKDPIQFEDRHDEKEKGKFCEKMKTVRRRNTKGVREQIWGKN